MEDVKADVEDGKTDANKTVKASLVVRNINDGLAYSVGMELIRESDGEPFRVYSLYYDAARDEIHSKRQAVKRALVRVIKELPKDTELLMVRSTNRLFTGYKNIADKLGHTGDLSQSGLQVYMRRANTTGSRMKRADMLSSDAADRKESIVSDLY